MTIQQKNLCPCCSGKPYVNCCQKYHQGLLPENALLLMRSRYAAYARGLADYIIETTHLDSPHYVQDRKQWLYQIHVFSNQTSFDGLEIVETQLLEPESFVTFVAHLSKEGKDLTFTERSRFLKQGHAWKYVEGKIGKGRLTVTQLQQI